MKPRALLLSLILIVTTVALHADESKPRPGRLVIGAEANKGLAIVDPDNNKVLWHYKIGAVHDLHLLENGHLLTQSGWPNVIEVDLNKNIVWSYDSTKQNAVPGKKVEIHAYQRLPNGHTMIVESGYTRLIEVTPEGDIAKQFPLSVDKPHPHTDTRLVRKLDNGHYLAAHEGDGLIREYDGEGKVVWEYEVPLFDKEPATGHGPEAWGNKAFCALRRDNGNTLIATGNGHGVIEVTAEKEIVWQLKQHDIPGVTLAWVTTLQELPNGNLIIGNCHAGPENPQIIEVTRDKKLVWSFKDFTTFGNSLANSIVLDGEAAAQLRERLVALDN